MLMLGFSGRLLALDISSFEEVVHRESRDADHVEVVFSLLRGLCF